MQVVNQRLFEESLRTASARVAPRVTDDVKRFLTSASDAELYYINPYRFAVKHGLDRTEALRAFLHLTKGGLFNVFWNVHCPACKGVTQQSDSLRSLRHTDTCSVCTTAFDAGFDKSLEVSFGVNPSIIKPAAATDFEKMLGAFDVEPGLNIEIDPGQSHYLKMSVTDGNYLGFINGHERVFNLVVLPGAAAAQQRVTFTYRDDLPPINVEILREGDVEIVISNRSASATAISFARMKPQHWPNASVVASLQDFRDLFATEMLSPNETFSIENLGFLFTDLKGSTELYERIGDAPAFALVKEHFYIMDNLVRANNGAIVKTIGDAVMAVFADPRDALRTAVEMIDRFDDLETAHRLKNEIIVKVGVHHGPCIAVTLNDRIDYFGTTVNIAARVQGLSDGRDVMASGALFSASDAEAFLRERGWRSEPFVTSLKGLRASHRIHKLTSPRA